MNNGTFAGRCLECNGGVSMRVQRRANRDAPKVWTGMCQNGHRLRLEIDTHSVTHTEPLQVFDEIAEATT